MGSKSVIVLMVIVSKSFLLKKIIFQKKITFNRIIFNRILLERVFFYKLFLNRMNRNRIISFVGKVIACIATVAIIKPLLFHRRTLEIKGRRKRRRRQVKEG